MISKLRTWFIEQKTMLYYEMFSTDGGWHPNAPELLDEEDSNQKHMRCLGLKDKNGKELYDGDIVRWETGGLIDNPKGLHQVIWGEDFRSGWGLCWALVSLKKVRRITGDINHAFNLLTDRYKPEELEIVGNVYENPEKEAL